MRVGVCVGTVMGGVVEDEDRIEGDHNNSAVDLLELPVSVSVVVTVIVNAEVEEVQSVQRKTSEDLDCNHFFL